MSEKIKTNEEIEVNKGTEINCDLIFQPFRDEKIEKKLQKSTSKIRYLNEKNKQLENMVLLNFVKIVGIMDKLVSAINENANAITANANAITANAVHSNKFFEIIAPIVADYREFREQQLEEVYRAAEIAQKRLI